MNTTTFRLGKMDCSAEELLVRMALDQVEGVDVQQVDLEQRTIIVSHPGDPAPVRQTLDALNLDMTQLATVTGAATSSDGNDGQRHALTIALAINFGLFVAELVAGLVARSMGLVADSLDMLADASVYALSLLAVGTVAARKKSLAKTSGYLQLGLAIVGLLEVARRFLTSEALPNVATMIVVSVVALAGNVATLMILNRVKSEDVHFQASWIFTANDIKVNTLVIIAAIVVAITNHQAADLLAGAAIFLIVANGARRIFALAR